MIGHSERVVVVVDIPCMLSASVVQCFASLTYIIEATETTNYEVDKIGRLTSGEPYSLVCFGFL